MKSQQNNKTTQHRTIATAIRGGGTGVARLGLAAWSSACAVRSCRLVLSGTRSRWPRAALGGTLRARPALCCVIILAGAIHLEPPLHPLHKLQVVLVLAADQLLYVHVLVHALMNKTPRQRHGERMSRTRWTARVGSGNTSRQHMLRHNNHALCDTPSSGTHAAGSCSCG